MKTANQAILPHRASLLFISMFALAACNSETSDIQETSAPSFTAPTELVVETYDTSTVRLTWRDGSDTEDGFRIYQIAPSEDQNKLVGETEANTTTFEHVNGISALGVYWYSVAVFKGDEEIVSQPVSITFDPGEPQAPTGLRATAIDQTQVELIWEDGSDNESGFIISVCPQRTNCEVVFEAGVNTTSYTVGNLEANTLYEFSIVATNVSGQSETVTNEATTLPWPPEAPGNLTAIALSQERIRINWEDLSDNEVAFRIVVRREFPPNGGQSVTSANQNHTESELGYRTANTSYIVEVGAYNDGGVNYASTTVTTLPWPPVAPTDFTATTISQTQIQLNWQDNADNETGYIIEDCTNPDDCVQLTTAEPNSTTFVAEELLANTSYNFRLTATNTGGNSDSIEAAATTIKWPPTAPSSLLAVANGQTQVQLSWSDNADNEEGYQVEVCSAAAGAGCGNMTSLAANTTAFTATGLDAVTTYVLTVRAYNNGGSNEVVSSVTTLPWPPAAPSNLSVDVLSQTELQLTWQDNADNETGYILEDCTNPGDCVLLTTIESNVTTFVAEELLANTSYNFRLTATNTGGNSDSIEAAATTLKWPPTAPSSLLAVANGQTEVQLSWSDNADNEEGYQVEVCSAAAGAGCGNMTSLAANTTAFTATGLDAVTTYVLTVRAYNNGGSNELVSSVTTLPWPPAAPSNLSVDVLSQTELQLTWQDNADNETGFIIEDCTSPTSCTLVTTTTANTTSYTLSGLNALTTYTIRVTGTNTGGNSSSIENTATTLPWPPSAPSSFTATAVNDLEISLQWVDTSDNETNFYIELCTGGLGGDCDAWGNLTQNTQFASVTGLAPDTLYGFKIYAYNTGGQSSIVTTEASTTPPRPNPMEAISKTQDWVSPSGITVGMTVEWAHISTNTDGYILERRADDATEWEIQEYGSGIREAAQDNLQPRTVYHYRIKAWNNWGESEYLTIQATSSDVPPLTPSDLNLVNITQTSMTATWQDQSDNESGFHVYLCLGTTLDNCSISSEATEDVGSVALSNLTDDTLYSVGVQAWNSVGTSSIVYQDISTLPYPPASPTDLAATLAASTIDLEWVDNSDNETGFNIYRATAQDGDYVLLATANLGEVSFSDSGPFVDLTQYFYKVKAVNAGGESGSTLIDSATWYTEVPAAPTHIGVNLTSSNSVEITWQDNATTETEYLLVRLRSDTWTDSVEFFGPANTSLYADTGLVPGGQYYWLVRARNPRGMSEPADIFFDMPVPSMGEPVNVTATALSTSQITIEWDDGSNDETGFSLKRSISEDGPFASVATVTANTTQYTNHNLNANTTYFYRVQAINSSATSALSAIASATTLNAAPLQPQGIAATAQGSSSIHVTWDAAPSNAESIRIERSTSSQNGPFFMQHILANGATYLHDTELTPFTRYYYRIRFGNDTGNSSWSDVVSAQTEQIAPETPIDFSVSALSHVAALIEWTPGDVALDSVQIQRRGEFELEFQTLALLSDDVNDYVDVGMLQSSATYYYRIRATNSAGSSAWTSIGSVTLPATPDTAIGAPQSPSSFTLTQEGGCGSTSPALSLSWTDSSDSEIGYRLMRSISAAGPYELLALLDANTELYEDSSVNPGTSYYYKLEAYNANGDSTAAIASGQAELLIAPNVPSNFVVDARAPTRLRFSWDAENASNTTFEIQRYIPPTGVINPDNLYQTVVSVTGITSNVLSGLSEDGTQTGRGYRIRASANGCQSGWSATTYAPRKLRIINNLGTYPGWENFNSIISVTIAESSQDIIDSVNADNQGLYEYLEPSRYICQDCTDQMEFIAPSGTEQTSYRDFDIPNTISSGYNFFIRCGWWDPWADGWQKHYTEVIIESTCSGEGLSNCDQAYKATMAWTQNHHHGYLVATATNVGLPLYWYD